MKFFYSIFIVLFSSLSAEIVVSMDPASEHQVIRGFGGSGAWYEDNYLRYSAEEHAAFNKVLFDPEEGIGLSIYRTRVHPQIAGENKPEPFDPKHEGLAEIARYVQEIQDVYDLTFKVVPWTPPAWMKSNKEQKHGGELLPEFYPAYAEYLVDYVAALQEAYGLSVDILSVQNEADSAKRWDSCIWSPEAMTEFTRDHLIPALDAAGLGDLQLMVNEDTAWRDGEINAILEDPVLAEEIDIAAAHLYWGGHRPERLKPMKKAQSLGKEVWMTEFYYGDYIKRDETHDMIDAQSDDGSAFSEMERTLALARIQHDSLTQAEVNAWLFWWVFSPLNKLVQGLLTADQDFTKKADVYTGYTVNKWAYGLGQFARFVRPGSLRIDASVKGEGESLLASAYRRLDGRLVAVVINLGPEAKAVELEVAGREALQWTATRTSKTENLEPVGSVSGDFVAPGHSITTLLQQREDDKLSN